MANKKIIVFLRDLTLDGKAVKAGDPLSVLGNPSWLTPAWIKEAEQCGHIGPQDAPAKSAEPQTSTESEAGGTDSAEFASTGEVPQHGAVVGKGKGKK